MSQELHKCPICGYEWQHGKSGEHDCVKRLIDRVNFLKTMLDGSEATIRVYEEQDKTQRLTIIILENLLKGELSSRQIAMLEDSVIEAMPSIKILEHSTNFLKSCKGI